MTTKGKKWALLLILVCIMSCACAEAEGIIVCSNTSELNVRSSTIWQKTDIHVCWDADAMGTEQSTHREMVYNIVEDTWNTALSPEEVPSEEWVKFVGWEECYPFDGHDIRITIGEGSSKADALGSEATYINLNYLAESIPAWDIKRVAIHEFGHVLGLAHEHNREDTGDKCLSDPQGPDGWDYYGEWDLNSVMNYCNDSKSSTKLSESDAYWIKRVYYPGYYQFECNYYVKLDGYE